MADSSRDAPYPELKKSHTMAHVGRPFTDFKPPAAAPVWAVIEGLGRYHVLLAALELEVFEALGEAPDAGMTADELAGRLDLPALHLEALLDSVVALGLLDRVVGHFRLNDATRHLVERAYAALRPEGRVVLADYFIGPNHKTNPHAVLMGMTMMASTVNGFGVTTETATGWLRDAGFKAVRGMARNVARNVARYWL